MWHCYNRCAPETRPSNQVPLNPLALPPFSLPRFSPAEAAEGQELLEVVGDIRGDVAVFKRRYEGLKSSLQPFLLRHHLSWTISAPRVARLHGGTCHASRSKLPGLLECRRMERAEIAENLQKVPDFYGRTANTGINVRYGPYRTGQQLTYLPSAHAVRFMCPIWNAM